VASTCFHLCSIIKVTLTRMSADSTVLGVVLLIRHGDRQGFYQDPKTYTPTSTAITPVGNVEELNLGAELRTIYLEKNSTSFIAGVNNTIATGSQLLVRADAGGEGGVIFESAISLLQGLFPPTPDYNTTLSNGTNVVGPFNGYQYVAIESVEPGNDISLEGFTSCPTLNTATNDFYNSSAFKQKEQDHADFINSLPQYLDGRTASLQNMWNIFDFMNVEDIHDKNFHLNLPRSVLAQTRDLANYHEYGIFSSPNLTGIGNIAGRTILPSIITGLQNIANPNNTVKLVYEAISYKPFLSLFNMTGAAQQNSSLAAIVDYAAAVALEVRQPKAGGEPVIRFMFKNGTHDTFNQYGLLGMPGDVPLSLFVDKLQPAAISDLSEWCDVCQNNADRGCGALALAKTQGASSVQIHQRISPVGAGFLGAGLTLAVALAFLAALYFMGCLAFGAGRSKRRPRSPHSDDDSANHQKV